jgi:hypothetical protein
MTTVAEPTTDEATEGHRSTARDLNWEPRRDPDSPEPDGASSTDADQFDPHHRISRLRDIWS